MKRKIKYACFLTFLLLFHLTCTAAPIGGKTIYARDCIACHGADGSGNTALGRALRPFPARDLRPKIMSRQDMRNIIMHGRGKTSMHAHGKGLSPIEVDRLIDYIRTFPYQARPAAGKAVFGRRCAHCHGADARGDTAFNAPDLILSDLSDTAMAKVIRQGRHGTLMGEFGHDLRNADIENILAWLRLGRYGLRSGASGHTR